MISLLSPFPPGFPWESRRLWRPVQGTTTVIFSE
jgi:hypothetical protein